VDGESSFAQTNPRAATWAKARAGDLITDIAASAKEETIAKLKSVLGEAYDNPNVTRQDVTDAISELWDAYPDWKADLISRTETAFAENGGTLAGYKDTGVEFVLVSDGTGDDICAAADGATWTVDAADANPLAHPNCLVGETSVTASQVRATFTRWFEGEIIVLRTAANDLLSVTPNHPILTDRGWVAAGLLNVGDRVVRSPDPERMTAHVDPDHEQVTASIEEIAHSLPVVFAAVPTAAEDFHGDGAHSKVHVVRTDGLLHRHIKTALVQHVAESQFPDADVAGDLALPSRRANGQLSAAQMTPSNGVMSRNGEALTTARIGVIDEPRCLASGSHRQPESAPLSAKCAATGPVLGSERVAALSGRIPSMDGPVVKIEPYRPSTITKSDSMSGQVPTNGRDPDAISFGELSRCAAGLVETSGLIKVYRRKFAGHVYNLETVRGWFFAGSIVTHNCSRSFSPLDSTEVNPDDVSEPDE
jgi:hypothetical protein